MHIISKKANVVAAIKMIYFYAIVNYIY